MSTTKGERPQPSDAAMAAAIQIDPNTDRDVSIVLENGTRTEHKIAALRRFIDRHFAPLREELARNARALEFNIQGNREGIARITELEREATTLRASNDKLRAAVEGTYSLALAWANYYAMQYDCKGGAHPRHRAILDEAKAALAPERKETT